MLSVLLMAAPNAMRAQTPTQPPATPNAVGANAAGVGTPIGRTDAGEVQVSGAVDLRNGQMQLGNGSTVTAGRQPVKIALTRGGSLRLCSTTSVHLSRDRSIDAPDSTALMMALDRGAIEANYTVGKYSDVLMTPDLRILISAPGTADLSVRVSNNGDTCVDNHGEHAPYITISSQLEGGLYRVAPNQHVTFEHGSLREVVDTEKEPCGCPAVPPVSVADAGTPSANPAVPGKRVGGPSSTPNDTEFPLAVSEGLAPAPPLPTTPVAAPGEVHAQVTVPFVYHGTPPAPATSDATNAASAAPPPTPVPSTAAPAPTPVPAKSSPAPAAASPATVPSPAPATAANQSTAIAQPAPPVKKQPSGPGFFNRVGHRVGRFFSKVFGAE
jgi:hypothetical protein